MTNIKLSDIYDLISNLSRRETHNYNNYMKNNPQDMQRTHDHIVRQSTYCEVLHMLNQIKS
jgi:hypothetical protein